MLRRLLPTSSLAVFFLAALATASLADNSDDNNRHSIISINAIGPIASENGSDPGIFTVTRSRPINKALTVNYTVSGTAIAGSGYVALSGSVTIPPEATSANIVLTGVDDLLAQGSKIVILTLAPSDDYTVGCPDSAVVTIVDDDASGQLIAVTATNPSASESSLDPGIFTVVRSGSSGSSLTVNYTVSGTATAASDYVALSGSVVIPAGQASASIRVIPVDDSTLEGDETVVVTLTPSANYTVGFSSSAIISITDDEEEKDNNKHPLVSIIATDPISSENGIDSGAFTITRSGAASEDLIVSYVVSGTGTAGSDFSALSGSLIIPSGANSAKVSLTPIQDFLVEGNEIVIISLAFSSKYTLDCPSTAIVSIIDDDPPGQLVTLTATDSTALENGLDPGVFTVIRSGPTTSALTVNYAVSGTATAGSDYVALSGSVIVPAGAASAEIIVTPVDDLLIESTETVVLSLAAGGYTVGSPSTATVAIDDGSGQGDNLESALK